MGCTAVRAAAGVARVTPVSGSGILGRATAALMWGCALLSTTALGRAFQEGSPVPAAAAMPLARRRARRVRRCCQLLSVVAPPRPLAAPPGRCGGWRAPRAPRLLPRTIPVDVRRRRARSDAELAGRVESGADGVGALGCHLPRTAGFSMLKVDDASPYHVPRLPAGARQTRRPLPAAAFYRSSSCRESGNDYIIPYKIHIGVNFNCTGPEAGKATAHTSFSVRRVSQLERRRVRCPGALHYLCRSPMGSS